MKKVEVIGVLEEFAVGHDKDCSVIEMSFSFEDVNSEKAMEIVGTLLFASPGQQFKLTIEIEGDENV